MGLEECAVDIKGVAAGVWLAVIGGTRLLGRRARNPVAPPLFLGCQDVAG
jgi:hypothetical protein